MGLWFLGMCEVKVCFVVVERNGVSRGRLKVGTGGVRTGGWVMEKMSG